METYEMRTKYIQLEGEKNKTQKDYDFTLKECNRLHKKYDKALVMQSLIQKASKNTQEKLKYSIEKIVTTALESVFDEEQQYLFELEFVTKNDQTHCIPKFIQSDAEYDGLADLGGSVADVGSFASRIAMWTLGGDTRTDPIFLLDESLKHLSEGFRENAGILLKAFCDELGLQIIMSTHLPVLRESADNKIHVEKRKGISHTTTETSL